MGMQLQTKQSPPGELILTPWIKILPLNFMLHVKIPPFLFLVAIIEQITPLLKVLMFSESGLWEGEELSILWAVSPLFRCERSCPESLFYKPFPITEKTEWASITVFSLGHRHVFSKVNKKDNGYTFGLRLPLSLSFNQYLLLSSIFLPFGIKKQLLSLTL